MAKALRTKPSKSNSSQAGKLNSNTKFSDAHVYNKKIRCITDSRGYKTHRNLSPQEIRIHETDGFIPLWAQGVTLRYRFREQSFGRASNGRRAAVQKLFNDAVATWGDAAPINFTHNENASDFELVMMPAEDCDASGCVLASAFFPDGGRHEFRIYPTVFEQSKEEQVETFAHEIGHIFGLRHFFANISETSWPSHLFGEDKPFSIMNYGPQSHLTDVDKADLKKLYKWAWNGELNKIDGAPIQLMHPYSSFSGHGEHELIAANILRNTPVQIVIGNRKVTVE